MDSGRVMWMAWVLIIVIMSTGFIGQATADSPPPRGDRSVSHSTSQPAKEVDEQLIRKLLGGKTSAADTVETTLEKMDQAAERLTDELDPGPKTQAIQREILKGLDQMIEQALQSRTRSAGKRHLRRKNVRPATSPRRKAQPKSGGSVSSPKPKSRTQGRGPDAGRKKNKGEKADLQRRWGALPQRDRMEISQGYDEAYLSKYRRQILQYYRNLADQAQRE